MTLTIRSFSLMLSAVLGLLPVSSAEDNGAQVLLLSKSQVFQHETIAEKDGQASQVEIVLRGLLAEHGMTLTATKDAGSINAENLKSYKLVIFYTQGDLTQLGLDKHPPMGADGVAALTEWIMAGGGFMGIHSATDTFRSKAGDDPTPYTTMIGAAFRGHGRQFVGTVRPVDRKHPTMASLPKAFAIMEEWYVFRQMNADAIHVLALLDAGEERGRQKMYDTQPYPIVWCRPLGEGRVYYNAMGHRPDVWENETFLSLLDDAVLWTTGQGPVQAEPNYAGVVESGTDE
ncbi:MAG: ThuA domain-containing protein [Candidatus Hydrogenedentes bacterium]|nr:ThuA domain-containing protein [Candidatus Hydrogenedentota bacterium]